MSFKSSPTTTDAMLFVGLQRITSHRGRLQPAAPSSWAGLPADPLLAFPAHRSPRVNCHAAFATRDPVKCDPSLFLRESQLRFTTCQVDVLVWVGRGSGLTVLTRSSVSRHRVYQMAGIFTLRACSNRPRTLRPGEDASRLIGRSPRFHATGYSALWPWQHALRVISLPTVMDMAFQR